MKMLLDEYLLLLDEVQCDGPFPSLSDVLFLGSDFWKCGSLHSSSENVPWKTKGEIIQAFLLMKRCREEIHMLEVDMTAVIQYWFDRIITIEKRLDELSSSSEDMYTCGQKFLLNRLKVEAVHDHQKAYLSFSRVIQVPSNIQLTSAAMDNEDLVIAEEETDSETEAGFDSDASETEF